MGKIDQQHERRVEEIVGQMAVRVRDGLAALRDERVTGQYRLAVEVNLTEGGIGPAKAELERVTVGI